MINNFHVGFFIHAPKFTYWPRWMTFVEFGFGMGVSGQAVVGTFCFLIWFGQ
jgi:hypothetical protein